MNDIDTIAIGRTYFEKAVDDIADKLLSDALDIFEEYAPVLRDINSTWRKNNPTLSPEFPPDS